MTRLIDRAFCALLAIATAGHLLNTFLLIEIGSALFVWSLSGVLAAALVVAVNVLRIERPEDRPVAWIAVSGSLCWIGIVLLFGRSIGNMLDPRVLLHALATAGLLRFGLRTLSPRRRSPDAPRPLA